MQPWFIVRTMVVMYGTIVASTVQGAVINVDTVIGPDYPHLQEAVTVVDGDDPPTDVTVLEGALFGTPSGPTADVALELLGISRATILGGFLQGNNASVVVRDHALFRMKGGEVLFQPIEVRDEGKVLIDGGRWNAVFSYDLSQVRITGPIDGNDYTLRTFGGSHAVVEGDEISLVADESSTVVVRGGEFHRIDATGNSRILVNGGFFSDSSPSAFDNGVVDIWSVGSIGEERIEAVGNGIVNIYGFGLRFDVEVDLDQTRDVIVGKLADGDDFRAEYRIIDQGQIILHEVPEPGTLGLLAAGAGTIVAASRWSRHLAGAWGKCSRERGMSGTSR